MKIIVSIDVGTSSICALALDAESNRVLCSKTLVNDADVAGLPAGHHEQNPGRILQRVESAVDAVVHKLKQQSIGTQSIATGRIAGIGVTGQMHGVVLLDRDNSYRTNLITWRDRRAGRSQDWRIINNKAAFAQRFGCFLEPGYGASTLQRLIEADPHLADAMASGELKAVGITDFIVAKLCGRVTSDYTMAASWGCFNVIRCEWEESLLKQLGIPQAVFPELVPPASRCGYLLPHYTKRWEVEEPLAVCAGVGDHQASVFATAPLKQGSCIVNVGTGAQVSMVREGFTLVEGLETRPLIDGYFLLTGSSLCGGWSYVYLAEFFREVVKTFAQSDVAISELLETMNRIAAKASNDGEGLTVDPRFLGTRASPMASGAIQGITTQNLSPQNLARATVNGMVEELYDYYRKASLPATSLHAAGNAVRRNLLLRETLARRWGMEPLIAQEQEEAARGAAYLAAVNLGLMAATHKKV